MDTTTEIATRLLTDVFSGDENQLRADYSKYYESLDVSQSKEVVSAAIRKIINENPNMRCEFGEDSFTLIADV